MLHLQLLRFEKSLFRIPDRDNEYSDRCRLWLKLLGEKKENMHKIRICSDHFLKSNWLVGLMGTHNNITGMAPSTLNCFKLILFTEKPAKKGDCLDIDWIPNKNLGNYSKNQKLVEYYWKTIDPIRINFISLKCICLRMIPIDFGGNRSADFSVQKL